MIINQPHDEQLGLQIISAIESNEFNQITIMVAYAKLSGVYRIFPYLEKFRNKGGLIRCVVGIDQQNTTYDALCQLLKLTSEVYVYHSESVVQTFHMKCYWMSGENSCWYAIGSNNLTAGGLFSNYELCSMDSLVGPEAKSINDTLSRVYSTYTDENSVCSHKLDENFLEQLITEGYVVKEIQQRKILIESAKKTQKTKQKNKLFGSEVFQAPKLPEEFRKSTSERFDDSTSPKLIKPLQKDGEQDIQEESTYLIRLVPRAGNRSKQVHFTIELLEKYFQLKQGDSILVQEMLADGTVCEIEQRHIVFSQRNRNVKIELAGASMLDTNYPKNSETRPVLVLKKVNANLFLYMILLSGDDGYDAINSRLKAIPAGRSLPYEVIDESVMFSVWENCPMV